MKILLFTLEYPPFYGGVANYYGNLVSHWPAPSNIFVLHNNKGKLISNKLPFLKWLPAVWRLWRAVKKENINHVLVGHILPLGTAAYLAAKFLKIEYSVFLHGMDLSFVLKPGRKKWLAKRILKRAKHVICVNSYTAGLVKEVFGAHNGNKIVVVNPGAPPQIKDLRLKIKNIINQYNLQSKIVLLSVGRLVKRKGFDKVIEAMPAVLKEAPDLVYVILGNGPIISDLRFQIKDLSIEKNIILITDADDAEKSAWYQLCDIFIMPSRNIDGDFEGFGIVYLEANLAGKPVIAGDSGGVHDAVESGLNGLLVNPEDVNDIVLSIIKLVKDKWLRIKLGEQGRERAVKDFNWEKQAGKLYNIVVHQKDTRNKTQETNKFQDTNFKNSNC